VYVVFAIVAYFTESGQEFAPKSIHELRWVILDTFAALYVYGVFRFREGIANQAYGIESKKEVFGVLFFRLERATQKRDAIVKINCVDVYSCTLMLVCSCACVLVCVCVCVCVCVEFIGEYIYIFYVILGFRQMRSP